jgi:Ca2+-binding RTX toxin-like protein
MILIVSEGQIDVVDGGAGDDTVRVIRHLATSTLQGGAGVDTLVIANNIVLNRFSAAENGFEMINFGSQLSGTVVADALDFSGLIILQTSGANVSGLAGDDVLTGSVAADLLFGNDGADRLSGGEGADQLDGGEGDDILSGGEGVDRLLGGVGNDLMEGGAGGDTLEGHAGSNTLRGGEGDDTLVSTGSADVLEGGAGDDLIKLHQHQSTPTVFGHGGVDTLIIANNVVLTRFTAGESGIEKVSFSSHLSGSGGDDHLDFSGIEVASGLGATVYGEAGRDTLIGTDKNDVLYGGLGDDVLQGGVGNDSLDGGDELNLSRGMDIASYAGATAGVTVDLTLQTVFQDTGGAGSDRLLRIEGLRGSAYDDVLRGFDKEAVLQGGAGDDQLIGGTGRDWMEGGAGNDLLIGGRGVEGVQSGGAGADTYVFNGNEDLGARYGNGAWSSPFVGDLAEKVELYAADGDILDLSGITAADGYQGDVSFGVDRGGMRSVIRDGYTEVEFDLNGNGTVSMQLRLMDEVELRQVEGTRRFVALEFAQGDDGENLMEGNAWADALHGRGGGDHLAGFSGDDRLYGEDGDDELNGGEGSDELLGGAGVDTAAYDNAAAAVWINLQDGAAQNTRGSGWDRLVSIENVAGSRFDDIIGGTAERNILWGGGGNDILAGGGGGDHLYGGEGDDRLGAHDVFVAAGGAGNDTYLINGHEHIIEYANEGIDTVEADASHMLRDHFENLRLKGSAAEGYGNALNNVIEGNAASNRLVGGDGDDRLDGGAGVDVMIGGVGNDTYVVDDQADALVELADEGVDTVESSISYALARGFENLVLGGHATIAGVGNSTTNTITGNGVRNVISGMGADDILRGMDGDDSLHGDEGADRLEGGAGADYLAGGDGVDRLDGGAGADRMIGGYGDDVYVVDDAGDTVEEAEIWGAADTVYASISYALTDHVERLALTGEAAINGTGNDLSNLLFGNAAANTLDGAAGNDVISGMAGDDALRGGLGADKLVGGDGKDSLDGGAGADLMEGGAGDDSYWVDETRDVVVEAAGGGVDTVYATVTHNLSVEVEKLALKGTAAINGAGNALNNVIFGNSAANVLNGSFGDDVVAGGLGDDYVIGGAGRDRLEGGEGADRLDGGAGSDLLLGGLGADSLGGGLDADVFRFATVLEAEGDRVTDFTRGDRLDLSLIDANGAGAGATAFSFIGAGAFTGVAGQLRATALLDGKSEVSGDVNGDGVADFTIVVTTDHALSAGDFVL